MNPLIILVVLVVGFFSWGLFRCLRAGEFKLGDGSYKKTMAHVRRDTNPVAFWILVAFQVGVILYVASFVFEM